MTQRLPRISSCVSPRNPHFVAPPISPRSGLPVVREPPDPKDTFRWRKCPSSQDRSRGASGFVCGSPTRTQKTIKSLFFEELPWAPRLALGQAGGLGNSKNIFEKSIFIEKYCLSCLSCPCAFCPHGIRSEAPKIVTTDTFLAEKCLLDPGRVCT